MEDEKKTTKTSSDVKKPCGGSMKAPRRSGGKSTYTVGEIADMLGVSKSCAYDLVRSGQFAYVHVGSSIRVSKAAFDKWLDPEGTQAATGERG